MSKRRTKVSKELLERLKAVKSKRARVVAEHILEHGQITTDDLRAKGYSDPYRPTQDLRDEGIPLEGFRVKNERGRSIQAYRLGRTQDIRSDRAGGRKGFSKKLRSALVQLHGNACGFCLTKLDGRLLQIDHRIPYQIAGENEAGELDDYMMVCAPCNRSKSWSCEHCTNFTETKDPGVCRTCYWANPNAYTHIAQREMRRMELIWTEAQVGAYDQLVRDAHSSNQELSDFVKAILSRTPDAEVSNECVKTTPPRGLLPGR